MEDTPLYNSRIFKNYIEYIRAHYPSVDIYPILEHAGMTIFQLEDGGHWFTQRQVDQFHSALIDKTRNPDIAREVGRNITFSKAASIVSQYAVGLVTPGSAYKMLSILTNRLTRSTQVSIDRINPNKIRVITSPRPGTVERRFQCQNRLGSFESIGKLFTGKYAEVKHPECIHEGGTRCEYIISWHQSPSFIWKKIRNYAVIAVMAALVALLVLIPQEHPVIPVAIGFLIIFAISLKAELLSNRELLTALESQGDAAGNLLDEINVRYNEALLVKEIGQAVSSILDIDVLFNSVMELLGKRLEFDRGMIMLSNKEKTRLVYQAGYGYEPAHKEHIRNMEINLNPDSRGPVVLAYKQKQAYLVNSINDIEDEITARSREFAEKLGAESFICIPIIYENESLGVLMVDNIKTKRIFSESHISLLMGIANQVAICINNIESYRKVLESEERFRSLSENAPDIIFTLSEQNSITYVNPAWERLLGHSKDEVVGQNFLKFIRKENADLYMTAIKRIWSSKETIRNFEGGLLAKSNSEKFFTLNAAPNTDPEGKVMGIICILKDITEKRSLEAQLRQAQKMEAIGTLAGGIAHDFNNILGAVMGYTEMAISDLPADSHLNSYLEQVLKSSTRAKDLIRQILTFSRQTEREFKPSRVIPTIVEATNLLRATIPATIEIRLEITTKHDMILTDSTQIHQVIMNLCTNAAHAMHQKGGVLQIDLGRSETIPEKAIYNIHELKPGPYLELCVTDSGHGMDAATIDRIFDPFFTTKKPGEGTGMGLSVVHGIVKAHGGAIFVESRLNKGTSFAVYFPLLVEEENFPSEQESHSPIAGGTERILFVDDEEPLVQLGREVLERLGYNVVTRTNGPEALNLFRSGPGRFDLVVTDLNMPNMTGMELAREMHQIRSDIPIILCTGFSESVIQGRLRDAGIRQMILKPIITRKLAAVIRGELDRIKKKI